MYDTDQYKYTSRIDDLRKRLAPPYPHTEDVAEVLVETLTLLSELVREIPTRYDPGQD